MEDSTGLALPRYKARMWSSPNKGIDPYYNKKYYLDVLKTAVQAGVYYDQREIREVGEALSWMNENAPGLFGVRRFRRAMDIESPAARFQAMAEALKMIERGG